MARLAAPKTSGTALVPWSEKYAKYAAEAKAITGTVTGIFISTQGGTMKVDKVPVPNNTLDCIAMAHIFENALYDGDFDPDNPAPPICFALGTVEDELTPHPDCEEPQVGKGSPNPEATGCADCPNNVFGSAEKGRGKVCKNLRRVGLVAADAVETGVIPAKVHYLKIPPTSLAAWDGYVSSMADTLHRPPFALVTQIKCVPPPAGKLGFRFEVSLKERLEDVVKDEKVLADLETKHLLVEKDIAFPYAPLSKVDREAVRQPKHPTKAARFTRQAAPAKGHR